MRMIHFAIAVLFGVIVASSPTRADSVSFDFNSGQPANTTLSGSASVVSTGGVGNSGALLLTPSKTGQIGSLTLGDLDPGHVIVGFSASFDMSTGNGSNPPADGISFNFGNPGNGSAYGEGGYLTSHSLTVSFDTFNNFGEAPGINVLVDGSYVAVNKGFNPYTNGTYVPVTLSYDIANGLTVTFNGATVYSNLSIPNFIPVAGDVFGIGGRTGAYQETNFVDNLSISTQLPASAAPLPTAAWGGSALLGCLAISTLRRRRQAVQG